MRGETLTITKPITFHIEECCECGVLFAMTQEFFEHAYSEKGDKTFYCTNGHPQSYVGKSDEQKRKEAVERARQAELREQTERDQRLAAERELKRHRQRAKGGACPVCKRTFVQVGRHMKTQHPNFEP